MRHRFNVRSESSQSIEEEPKVDRPFKASNHKNSLFSHAIVARDCENCGKYNNNCQTDVGQYFKVLLDIGGQLVFVRPLERDTDNPNFRGKEPDSAVVAHLVQPEEERLGEAISVALGIRVSDVHTAKISSDPIPVVKR